MGGKLIERTAEQYRADAAYLSAKHNTNAARALEDRAGELEAADLTRSSEVSR